ncbi:hypothetical protein DFH94DRAFT_827707 [Russula ochroleuca]|uniref:Non-specific serine/threonine protein kinase n=1 Tax=Russula ochroleuca TaxID=152965 RepID=A0A9P5T9W3_9AGAM|nr:hypothetical protein DFH94DRAFT_827707 [Russula ochroleuca]
MSDLCTGFYQVHPFASLPLTNPGWCISQLHETLMQQNQGNIVDFGLANLGVEQAQHDGLELLTHTLMYFLRGALPWQRLKAATKKQKYDRIVKKVTTHTDLLCHSFCNEFDIFLTHTCALQFDDKLDYSYLWKLFCDLLTHEGCHSATTSGKIHRLF